MSNTLRKTAHSFKRLVLHLSLCLIAFTFLFILLNVAMNGPDIWSLIVSVVSLVIFVSWSMLIYLFQKILKKELRHLTHLEKCADLSKICGEIQVIPNAEDNISLTINALNKQ
jgi:hypothetical protein